MRSGLAGLLEPAQGSLELADIEDQSMEITGTAAPQQGTTSGLTG